MSTFTIDQKGTLLSRLMSFIAPRQISTPVDITITSQNYKSKIEDRLAKKTSKLGKELYELEYQILTNNVSLYLLTINQTDNG